MKRGREDRVYKLTKWSLDQALRHRMVRCLTNTNIFGDIWLTTMNPWGNVMVKKVKSEERVELERLAALRHPNVMQIYAIEPEEGGFVFPTCTSKNLDMLLGDKQALGWSKRYDVVRQAVDGLAFLHTNGIIYKHVEPRTLEIAIRGDSVHASWMLGMKPHIDQRSDGYRPPEFLTEEKFSKESDVFAFGVMVSQVVTMQKIYTISGRSTIYIMDWVSQVGFDPVKLICPQMTDEVDMGQLAHLASCIIKACYQRNPSKRPSMTDISRSFITWYHNTNGPIPQQQHIHVTNHVVAPTQPSSSVPGPCTSVPRQPVQRPNRVPTTQSTVEKQPVQMPNCVVAPTQQNNSIPRQPAQAINHVVIPAQSDNSVSRQSDQLISHVVAPMPPSDSAPNNDAPTQPKRLVIRQTNHALESAWPNNACTSSTAKFVSAQDAKTHQVSQSVAKARQNHTWEAPKENHPEKDKITIEEKETTGKEPTSPGKNETPAAGTAIKVAEPNQNIENENDESSNPEHDILPLCLSVIKDAGHLVPDEFSARHGAMVDLNCDAIGSLLEVMGHEELRSDLAWRGCRALKLFCSFAKEEDNSSIWKRIGQQLTRAMLQFPDNEKVQLNACVAFIEIYDRQLGCPDDRVSSERVFAVATAMMQHVHSANLQREALLYIWNASALASTRPHFPYEVVSDALLKVVKAHGNDSVVQQRICGIFGNISMIPEGQARLNNSTAVSDILAAMKKHPQVPEVARWACFAIQHLHQTHSCNESQSSRELILQVLDTMHSHMKDEYVQEAGCGAIATLALVPKYTSELMRARCFEVIVNAMKNHKNNAQVQSNACCAVANCSSSGTDLDPVQLNTFQVVKWILRALKTHKRLEEVVEMGCCALENLSEHASEQLGSLAPQIRKRVTEAKKRFKNHSEITEHCENTLDNLSNLL